MQLLSWLMASLSNKAFQKNKPQDRLLNGKILIQNLN